MSHTLSYQSYVGLGFSSRVRLGLMFAKMFRDDFGPAYNTFS